MYVLLKCDGMKKVWLWRKGYFSLVRKVLQKPGKETWSDFFLWAEYLVAPLYTALENSQVMHLFQLKIESHVYLNNWWCFQQSWNLFSIFFYQKRKDGCAFFPVDWTMSSQCIKILEIIKFVSTVQEFWIFLLHWT